MINVDSQWSLQHTMIVLVCIVLLLVAYPALLILAHDLPNLPKLSPRRLFDPVGPPLFPFENVTLAFIFVSGFVSVYAALFGKEAKYQYILITTLLATTGYGLGIYLINKLYPLSISRLHSPACAGLDSQCYPYIAHGLIMLFSASISTIISERLLHRLAGRDVFGYPRARFRSATLWVPLYLIAPILLYPIVLLFSRHLSTLTVLHFDWLFESIQSHFVYWDLVLSATFIVIFLAGFISFFVRGAKTNFFVLASICSLIFYSAALFGDVWVSSLTSRKAVCAPGVSLACPPAFERGVLLALAITWAIVLAGRLLGANKLYEQVN
jgi:hypothetical protein